MSEESITPEKQTKKPTQVLSYIGRQRWEYKTQIFIGPELDEKVQNLLNVLGSEGWELVNVVMISQTNPITKALGQTLREFYFKRPVKI